ncbi:MULTISPECIES: oligoendopeptidase F [Ignavibacterium]|jgi:oligoendopeptidase F|uniref:oligoendopeptidase F n=1 Tax=Ignavibacterium TaxID=795750 RepID=UPI0025BD5947|nr:MULTISPECIES: oligoendopeptidase F [Ignavibacterium]MBI5661369.1 oligoendopeptidase F [Ignavibacterium album]
MEFNQLNKLLHTLETLTTTLPTRDQIDEKYKWNLKDVYESDELWEKDFQWTSNNLIRYSEFRGKLADSASSLLGCLKLDEEIGIKLERLALYAMLAKDSDMRISKYHAMDDKIKNLYARALSESSFIKPEILSIDENILKIWLEENSELKVYEHYIDDILREKPHTLDSNTESILALSTEIAHVPYNTYSIFTNAEMKFPYVKDENGNEIQMSHGRYYAAMYSKDRAFRESAFKAYLTPYKEYVNSLNSLFTGNLKSNIFYAKVRKYKSAREAALSKNNIPLSVYDNLVDAVNENFAPMYRWAKLKKELLGVDKLHPYDIYVTLFDQKYEKKYSYDEAVNIVLNSLEIMGDDYINSLNKAFSERWIDVYETAGKRSGAYSSGTTYGVHPYVMLNWTNLLNDVFTLAHEMGHNMHSYYTGQSQPFHYANYSIFLAEVASTFNESLLLEYLIKNSNSKEEKLHLLERYLNNITSTFYRQVMFAEFEQTVYEKTEAGESLTPEQLCNLYSSLFQKYWGPEMHVDEEESFTWARVPHFYYNFYVFQYATGMAASETLAHKVKTEGEMAVVRYIEFLKAGNSDYPINVLKKAGVDMNSPEPVLSVTRKMNSILDELESLL